MIQDQRTLGTKGNQKKNTLKLAVLYVGVVS